VDILVTLEPHQLAVTLATQVFQVTVATQVHQDTLATQDTAEVEFLDTLGILVLHLQVATPAIPESVATVVTPESLGILVIVEVA